MSDNAAKTQHKTPEKIWETALKCFKACHGTALAFGSNSGPNVQMGKGLIVIDNHIECLSEACARSSGLAQEELMLELEVRSASLSKKYAKRNQEALSPVGAGASDIDVNTAKVLLGEQEGERFIDELNRCQVRYRIEARLLGENDAGCSEIEVSASINWDWPAFSDSSAKTVRKSETFTVCSASEVTGLVPPAVRSVLGLFK